MIYHFPNLKKARSTVIVVHALLNSISKICLFSCGHAYKSLHTVAEPYGIEVHWIRGEDRYYSREEVNELYPSYFDATCGALSIDLMHELGCILHKHLLDQGYNDEILYVPVGSGETIVALGHHIPHSKLIGYHSKDIPAIRFDYSHLKTYVNEHFKLIDLECLPSIMWTLT